jgi:hypothetical protein
MMNPRRAARQLLDRGAISALAAALLLSAAAAPLAAQQRQNPNHGGGGGDRGGGRVATPSPPSSSTPSTRSGDSDSPSRTAHPTGGGSSGGGSEPSRQPPTRHSGGGRDGGGHYHGGGGYYYDPYYSPYWYGFWYRGYPGWYYGPGAYYYPYRQGYDDRNVLGALDLDVSPAKAEIYLDGHYVGVVDQYDGFPQYLWLEKGTYDVVLFKDGFRTISRQITIYPGLVIGVDDRMEPGESVRPENLATKTHDRRDARIRDEDERREQGGRDGNGRDGRDGDWRDRVRDDRDHWRDGDHDGDRARANDQADDDDDDDEENAPSSRAADDRGRVRLQVEPGDASVYLDGKFVGTGAELAELRSGLLLDPGSHKLSIVRPGYKSEETKFDVQAGKTTDLEIELDSFE